jgi:hypothetical protein
MSENKPLCRCAEMTEEEADEVILRTPHPDPEITKLRQELLAKRLARKAEQT